MPTPTDAPQRKLSLLDENAKCRRELSKEAVARRAAASLTDGLSRSQRAVLAALFGRMNGDVDAMIPAAAVAGDVCAEQDPTISSEQAFEELLSLADGAKQHYPLLRIEGSVGGIDGDRGTPIEVTKVGLSDVGRLFYAPVPALFTKLSHVDARVPFALNGAFPVFMVNGFASGKTVFPPHNLGEICDALILAIDRPELSSDDLFQVIKGPDFASGGVVSGGTNISGYMRSGKAALLIRGEVQVEEFDEGKRTRLVITSLPPGITPTMFLSDLVKHVREMPDIADFRNESNPEVRIVIDLRVGCDPHVLENVLYTATSLELKLNALLFVDQKNGRGVVSLPVAIVEHLNHQIDYETAALESERQANDAEIARLNAHTEAWKEAAILSVAARAALKLPTEPPTAAAGTIETLNARNQEIDALLSEPGAIKRVVRQRLEKIKAQFGEPRRSRISSGGFSIKEEDMVADESTVVLLTKNGMIKRTPADAWRTQRRGGRGVAGIQATAGLDETADVDQVAQCLVARARDWILFLTSTGRAYLRRVFNIPEGERNDPGKSLVTVLALKTDEQVVAAVAFRNVQESDHLVIATNSGEVKKVAMSEFTKLKNAGVLAIKLGDERIVAGAIVGPGDDIMLVSNAGMSIRFKESDVSARGRNAGGVGGIMLEDKDRVTGMVIPRDDASLLVAGESGVGKRTPFSEYGTQSRNGKGITTMKTGERTGALIAALRVREEDEVLIATSSGRSLRLPVAQVQQSQRHTSGSILLAVAEGETLRTMSLIPAQEDSYQSQGAPAPTVDAVETGEARQESAAAAEPVVATAGENEAAPEQ